MDPNTKGEEFEDLIDNMYGDDDDDEEEEEEQEGEE